MKTCVTCKERKPDTEFYGKKKKVKGGIRMYAFRSCMDCVRKANRDRYRHNRLVVR